jgi:hypothetical protein
MLLIEPLELSILVLFFAAFFSLFGMLAGGVVGCCVADAGDPAPENCQSAPVSNQATKEEEEGAANNESTTEQDE